MLRHLPLALAIGLVLGTGAVRGLWTNRWSASQDVHRAVARLALVPNKVGPWEGIDQPFDLKEVRAAGIEGAASRRYTNAETGQVVDLLIVCGTPGPIAVHTPDVCYGGSGYAVLSEDVRNIEPGGHEFRRLRMTKPDAVVPEYLDVNYAWSSADGHWQAPSPDRSRFVFAGGRFLDKLYAIRSVPPAEAAGDRPDDQGETPDPALEFLKALLPALKGTVFAPADPA